MPIGPVNVEIARRSLRSGFLAGAAVGWGAVTVDVSYAVVYSLGVSHFVMTAWVFWPVAITGVLLLIYLGLSSLCSARSAARNCLTDQPSRPSVHGGYLTGLLMTASNPMTLAFWFTVMPAFVGRITDQPWRDMPVICAGVFLGAMGWVIVFAGLLGLAGRFRKPWWMSAADEAGGVMLLALAAVALLRAIRGYL